MRMKSLFSFAAVSTLAMNIVRADIEPTNVTAHELNQNSVRFIGKEVTLSGRIQTVLGNGEYIISDAVKSASRDDRVLIFVKKRSVKIQSKRQEAGRVGSHFKQGDFVKLNGKVESEKSKLIIVAQPWEIQKRWEWPL